MGSVRNTVLATFVTAVALSGCGKIVEKAVEKASGCKDININDKGGSAKCGNNSVDVGGNSKIPEGFPSELKPPSNAKLYAAIKDTSNGTPAFILTMVVPGDAKDVGAALKRQLTRAGYSISDDSISEGSSGVGGSLQARNAKYEAGYIFGQNPNTAEQDQGTYITLTVRELTSDEQHETTTTSDSSGSGSPSSTRVDSNGGDSSSSGTSLPSGFPVALAPPDGSKITMATKNTSDGKTTYLVSAELNGSVDDVYKGVKSQVTSAGYTVSGD